MSAAAFTRMKVGNVILCFVIDCAGLPLPTAFTACMQFLSFSTVTVHWCIKLHDSLPSRGIIAVAVQVLVAPRGAQAKQKLINEYVNNGLWTHSYFSSCFVMNVKNFVAGNDVANLKKSCFRLRSPYYNLIAKKICRAASNVHIFVDALFHICEELTGV